LEHKQIIALLELSLRNPSEGLPEDIFLFVSRITPLVNVDLLIKSEQGRTLLTWRDDGYYPPGWHIPGGILRYKETMCDRIHAAAISELGTDVQFNKEPLSINEIIQPAKRIRGHFISFLFACTLVGTLDNDLRHAKGDPKPGQWKWHKQCPDNLISVHDIYRAFI
jgi:ADP-ribose pyrophosphatase YjhB (NUDIX family)